MLFSELLLTLRPEGEHTPFSLKMDSVLFQGMVVSRKVLIRTQNSENRAPRQILSTFFVLGPRLGASK